MQRSPRIGGAVEPFKMLQSCFSHRSDLQEERSVHPVLEDPNGVQRRVQVKKGDAEELGLNFDTYLMDEPRPCSNRRAFVYTVYDGTHTTACRGYGIIVKVYCKLPRISI